MTRPNQTLRDVPAIAPVDWAADFFSPRYLTLYREHLIGDDVTATEAGFAADQAGLTPDALVLDLACGFGRHLHWWRAQGFHRVVGLDLNFEFLRSARQPAGSPEDQSSSSAPPLVQGMAERLPFAAGVFDAVFCLFNSFGYQDLAAVGIESAPGESCDIAALSLAERASRGALGREPVSLARDEAIVAEAARALKPGGLLMIDVPARRGMIATVAEHPVTHIITSGGFEITERWSVDHDRHLLFNEGCVSRRDKEWHYRYCLHLYDLASLHGLLGAGGFEIVNAWEDFEGGEFDDEDSDRLIVMARRS